MMSNEELESFIAANDLCNMQRINQCLLLLYTLSYEQCSATPGQHLHWSYFRNWHRSLEEAYPQAQYDHQLPQPPYKNKHYVFKNPNHKNVLYHRIQDGNLKCWMFPEQRLKVQNNVFLKNTTICLTIRLSYICILWMQHSNAYDLKRR